MKIKQVLFIPGGGDNGYEPDKALFLSLKKRLGKEYKVSYPEIRSNETCADFGWTKQIGEAINGIRHDFSLVGHSLVRL